MKLNLRKQTGLPIAFDLESSRLILGEGLNQPSYRTRKTQDHAAVWARPVQEEDRAIYFYTSGLWLAEDEALWRKANVIYGIVVFPPGIFGGEYVKSAGQYHPLCGKNTQATPEIYTVLHGTGHFLLQKSVPPYGVIEDAVLVEVEAGESFIVPPDYGHLQINPAAEPLIFSYTVLDGMQGVYEPFRQRRGAIYYEMAEGQRYAFNPRYASNVPLRLLKASDFCQMPLLSRSAAYPAIRDHLREWNFLANPSLFPEAARLPEGGTIVASPTELRFDQAETGMQAVRHQQTKVKHQT